MLTDAHMTLTGARSTLVEAQVSLRDVTLSEACVSNSLARVLDLATSQVNFGGLHSYNACKFNYTLRKLKKENYKVRM